MPPMRSLWTMFAMLSPTVPEIRTEFEAVTPDPFVADLGTPSATVETPVAKLARRIAVTPHRRIYD